MVVLHDAHERHDDAPGDLLPLAGVSALRGPTMINGSQRLGRSFLRSKLLGTSNAAYVKKKAVKHQLYWLFVIFRSSCSPSIFALPMLPPATVRDETDRLEAYGPRTRGDREPQAWGSAGHPSCGGSVRDRGGRMRPTWALWGGPRACGRCESHRYGRQHLEQRR